MESSKNLEQFSPVKGETVTSVVISKQDDLGGGDHLSFELFALMLLAAVVLTFAFCVFRSQSNAPSGL